MMLKLLRSAGQLISAPMDHSVVPQQGSNGGLPYRLSTIERQELELARRRAEKAAEGKRANAAQARAKRRAFLPDLSFLCRLLRNRVSAQQARERKKSYVSNLEQQAKTHEQSVSPHARPQRSMRI